MLKNAIFMAMIVLCIAISAQQLKEYKAESLSMKDCLLRALKFNLDLEIEGYNPKIREFDIRLAKSVFDPAFTSSFGISEAESESSADLKTVYNVRSVDFQMGIAKKHLLGGTVGLSYGIGYSKQMHIGAGGRNPSWQHNVSLQFTQPLLRNLGIEVNQLEIQMAEKEKDQAFYSFQNKVITVLSDVQTAYWNLVNAIANYELQRKSLELAENLYKITLARIKAGSLAAADILEAERNVASKQDSLILAEKAIYDAEDRLKQLIHPLDLKYYQDVRMIPTEVYVFKKFDMDFESILKQAFLDRPDLLGNKLALENTVLNIEKNKNQLLPKLDLSSELGYKGVGTASSEGWDKMKDGDMFSWSVQLSLEIPLGNRAASSRYMQSLLLRKQAIAQYKKLESLVITELRSAIRELSTTMQRVETAQRTRELAEKQLANEENKFRAGIIALFQVQDTEQKLTVARINESNALLDYQRAIVQLEKAKGTILKDMKRYGISLDAGISEERTY
ncbi:MAG: TolC family protein [Candidatus Brocadiae bacterium]|nr:TolC family protein [Candidatus Brocadiia bacterium]